MMKGGIVWIYRDLQCMEIEKGIHSDLSYMQLLFPIYVVLVGFSIGNRNNNNCKSR